MLTVAGGAGAGDGVSTHNLFTTVNLFTIRSLSNLGVASNIKLRQCFWRYWRYPL